MSAGGQGTVFVSGSAHARLEHLAHALRARPRNERLLILTPAPRAVAPLLARVLAPTEACFAFQRTTLGELARTLSREALAAGGRASAAPLSLLAVCSRAIAELSRENGLGRFAGVASRPGLVRTLLRIVSELRLSGISVGQLAAHDAELARILERYEQLLGELELADRADVLRAARLAVTERRVEGAAASLLGAPLFWLDIELHDALSRELAAALVAQSPTATLSAARGDAPTLRALSTIGGLHVVEDGARVQSALGRVQRDLFEDRAADAPTVEAHGSTREQDQDPGAGSVTLLTSPGEAREAVEIARRILWAAERGVAFDRVAIVLRALDPYRTVLEEALGRAQIPVHFHEGLERPDREGRALLALLDCAREGLSARAFAEYLSLAVAPATDEAPSTENARLPLRRFERLLSEAVIVGGLSRWERRLAGLAAELRRDAAARDMDDPRREELLEQAADVAQLTAFALPLLRHLDALPRAGNWGAWIGALTKIAQLAIAAPEPLLETLGELAPLAPVGPVTLDEVRRLLEDRLRDVVLRDKGRGAGKVQVLSTSDALGQSFAMVFVPGLAEKIFPPRVVEDPLLPDATRRALSRLFTTQDRVDIERQRLRNAVGLAEAELVLSYPRLDLEHGRPRVPSFYTLEVLRAVNGTLPGPGELAQRTEHGAAARIGFPAPVDGRDAIDEAELDLAVLHALFSANADEKRGAARYLLETHVTLARVLRFRARRYSLRRFSHADGLVAEHTSPPDLLARQRLAARPYSVSALSTFARCPYAFFLQTIVGLADSPDRDSVEELDLRQRGIVFHEAQEAILRRLETERLLPVTPARLSDAQRVLREELTALVHKLEDELAPAVARTLGTMTQELETDLVLWLGKMSEEPRWVPLHFELGFGLARRADRPESAREPLSLDAGVQLRGAIDLVEAREPAREQSAERAENGASGALELRATDHKTGEVSARAGSIVQGGSSLQPLFYALALERLFPEARVSGGRLYYSTRRGAFSEHFVPLDARTRSVARDLVQAIDESIARAFLPAAPAKDACQHCAYRVVCGPYEEERVSTVKDLRALELVSRVRSLP